MRPLWNISKETLQALIDQHPDDEMVARKCGVTRGMVFHHRRKHGIPSPFVARAKASKLRRAHLPPREKRWQPTKKEIRDLTDQFENDAEAAELCGVTRSTFRYHRAKFKIFRKNWGNTTAPPPRPPEENVRLLYGDKTYEDCPRAARREQLFCWVRPGSG